MLILGKFKDYYDYLSGIYGIDKDIVYDRSDATVLGKEFSLHEDFFTKRVLYNDSQKKMKKRWITNENGKDVFANVPTGQISAYVIEIGYTHYLFEIEIYLYESGNVNIYVRVSCGNASVYNCQSSSVVNGEAGRRNFYNSGKG